MSDTPDDLRRRAEEARLRSLAPTAMTDTPDPDPDLLRRMEEAMLNMPKLQREIFLGHRLDNMSYGEIAERTGLTVRQVERHMAKALYKLVKQLDGRKLSLWERWF